MLPRGLFIFALCVFYGREPSLVAATIQDVESKCRKIARASSSGSSSFKPERDSFVSKFEQPLSEESRIKIITSLRALPISSERYLSEVSPGISLRALIKRFEKKGLNIAFIHEALKTVANIPLQDLMTVLVGEPIFSLGDSSLTMNELIIWMWMTGSRTPDIAKRVKSLEHVRDVIQRVNRESPGQVGRYYHPYYGLILEGRQLQWPNAMNFFYDQWGSTDEEIAEFLGISETALLDFYTQHSIQRDLWAHQDMFPFSVGEGAELIQSRREQKRRIILDDSLVEVERALGAHEPLRIKYMPYSIDIIHDYFGSAEHFFLELKKRGVLRGVEVPLISVQLQKAAGGIVKEWQKESIRMIVWLLNAGKSLSDVSLMPAGELGFGWREFVGFTASDGAGRVIFSKQYKALEEILEAAIMSGVSPALINYIPNEGFSKRYQRLLQALATEVYLHTFLTTRKFPVQDDIESRVGLSWESLTGMTQTEGHRVFGSFEDLMASVEKAVASDPRFTEELRQLAYKQIKTARTKSQSMIKAKRYREKGGLNPEERADLKQKVQRIAAEVFLSERRLVNRPELEAAVDMTWIYIIGTPTKGKTENPFRIFDSISEMYAAIREEIMGRSISSDDLALLDSLIRDRIARSEAMTGRVRRPRVSSRP